MSDVHQWLAAHERGVPPALARHMRDSVVSGSGTSSGTTGTSGTVDDLLSGGESMLRSAIAAIPMTRAQALDVLGADALVTYAFEAAADEPRRLVERADAAMSRIAVLAEEVG